MQTQFQIVNRFEHKIKYYKQVFCCKLLNKMFRIFIIGLLICAVTSRPQLKEKDKSTELCDGNPCSSPNNNNTALFENTFQFVIVDSPVLVVEPKKKPTTENKNKNKRNVP